MGRRVRLRRLGVALGAERRDAAATAALLGLDADWIHRRTGIRSRRVVAPGQDISSLAIAAAREAIADGPPPDLVVVATVTAAEAAPALACRVQAALGLRGPAFDVSAACAGFVYGLATVRAHLLAGDARRALLVGADVLSPRVAPHDRDSAILFGDAAGAVVVDLGPEEGPGVVAVHLGGDPTCASALRLDAVVHMAGRIIYRHGARRMVEAVQAVCAKAGWALEEIDVLVPHQANQRLIEAVARRLGLPPERLVCDIETIGNTSAASVPVALARAEAAGRLQPGARVVLLGLGAGLVWGAAALVWGGGRDAD